LRQLLLDLQPMVQGKTIDELAAAFELPARLRERLGAYQRWEQIRSDVLQLDVLTHVEWYLSSAHTHN